MYVVITGRHTVDCHRLFKSWTAIDGPDGVSLLSVRFHSDEAQSEFEALEGVQALPASGPIAHEHAKALAAMGLPVTLAEHTRADIKRLARLHCPGML